jgi:hypothetical protein
LRNCQPRQQQEKDGHTRDNRKCFLHLALRTEVNIDTRLSVVASSPEKEEVWAGLGLECARHYIQSNAD